MNIRMRAAVIMVVLKAVGVLGTCMEASTNPTPSLNVFNYNDNTEDWNE